MVSRVDGEIEAGQIKLIATSSNEGLIDLLSLSIGSIGEFLEGLGVLLEEVKRLRANLLNEVLAVGAGSVDIHLIDEVWLAQADPVGDRAGPILLINLDDTLASSLGHAAHAACITWDGLFVCGLILSSSASFAASDR